MNIQHHKKGNTGKFFISEQNKIVAQMTYTIEEDNMVIEHTLVDESLRGKDIGTHLVNEGVKFAKETGKMITPICTFAKKILEGNIQYKHVLASGY